LIAAGGLDALVHQPRHDLGADDIPPEGLLGDEFEGAKGRAGVSIFCEKKRKRKQSVRVTIQMYDIILVTGTGEDARFPS
jgi:hypothetical protein